MALHATDGSLIRSCGACGAKNRTPGGHLASTGRCGACKAELPPVSDAVEVDEPTFNSVVQNAKVPVLVDFWADWCAPCRMAAPHVAAVARRLAGKAIVLKVDTEAHPQLAAAFGVRGIPNFVVLRNGQAVAQRAGLAGPDELQRWLMAA